MPISFIRPTPSKSILITAGYGDLITLESYFPKDFKQKLRTVYYASPRAELAGLLEALPCYSIQNHFVFDPIVKPLYNLEDVSKYLHESGFLFPPHWNQVEDYSIHAVFARIRSGELSYQGSSFLTHKLAEVKQQLPDRFICIHPATETDQDMPKRSFYPHEWNNVINWLDLINLPAVVVNKGKHPVPEHNRLINLTNETNMLESIEILKRATGYCGVDSWLSVLAAKLFAPPLFYVKGNSPNLEANKSIYFAPKTQFPFIYKRLFDG